LKSISPRTIALRVGNLPSAPDTIKLTVFNRSRQTANKSRQSIRSCKRSETLFRTTVRHGLAYTADIKCASGQLKTIYQATV
jgi:hypothetical protein